ncbi:hypothetical protein KP509_04G112400 [Ceratopteris richardii]|nr:hypothetical protein KP509_04G112400 [Ceratopteris richardii]
MKRELVQLLQSNQEPSARIRVEHIFREQNIMAAYELIELFCELVVVRLPIIDSQKQCPIDLREAIASLIFAAPRCSDVPELLQVRNLLSAKFGKEFVIAAAELRPDCGVNRVVIEKLSVKAPSGEVKLKLMKDIADEHNFDWDPSATESELLKAPEDLLEGPTRFLGASQMPLETSRMQPSPLEQPHVQQPPVQQPPLQRPPLQPTSVQPSTFLESLAQKRQEDGFEESKAPIPESITGNKQFIPFLSPVRQHSELHSEQSMSRSSNLQSQNDDSTRDSLPHLHRDDVNAGDDQQEDAVQAHSNNRVGRFKDAVAAARAAAESAERAAAAARAAALLASEKFVSTRAESSSESGDDDSHSSSDFPHEHQYADSTLLDKRESSRKPVFDELEGEESAYPGSFPYQRTTQNEMRGDSWARNDDPDDDNGSMGGPSWKFTNEETFGKPSFGLSGSGPQFDSDESEIRRAEQSTSHHSRIHSSAPDLDTLGARFEALKSRR